MSSPFAPVVLLVSGLLLLFGGERFFSEDTWIRVGLDVLGAAGVVLSIVARSRVNVAADEAKRWIGWLHTGLTLALVLYVVQTPAVLGRMGWAADTEKTVRTLAGVIWPIALTVSVLALLFLDTALIASRRMPEPEVLRVRASAQTGLVLGLLVAIFGLSNYLANAHSPEVDLSRRKVARPSEATLTVVKNLEAPLHAAVFFPDNNEVFEEIEPYLRHLESGSEGKLVLHHFDHALEPVIAKRVNARDNGAIYFTKDVPDAGGDDKDPPPLFNEKLQIGLKKDSAKNTLKKFDEELQKRVLKLARGTRRIYFTTGHGERNARGGANVDKEDGRGKLSKLNRFLTGQSYEVKLLSVTDGLAQDVPADAAAVVIAGPTDAFLDSEIESLKRYFDRGGSVMVMLEPAYPAGVPAKLLEHLGVLWDPTLVAFDKLFIPDKGNESDRVIVPTNKVTSHASVTVLSRNKEHLPVIVPRSGTVAKVEGTKRNASLVLQPLPGAWKDTNADFKKDEKEAIADKLGYVASIESETKTADGKAGKAMVVASTELFDDKWLGSAIARTMGSGQQQLLSDGMKWLAGDEKAMAPIAMSEEDIPIKHTRKENAVWFLATFFLAPAMVLGGGLTYVKRARRRRVPPAGGVS